MTLIWRSIEPLALSSIFHHFIVDHFASHALVKNRDYYVTHGLRSRDQQEALYNIYLKYGRPLAAPPGKSAHEFGLAIDVAVDVDEDRKGLQPTWDTTHLGWVQLRLSLITHPFLESGSLWKSRDWPHIQMRNWRDFK